jgi:putative spermidine/putrescine transport system permease protein/spermidine/putrescine transport system permease protein
VALDRRLDDSLIPQHDTRVAALNKAQLARLARNESLSMLALFIPALILVSVFLIVPVGWLFCLSFVSQGQLSLTHYARMLTYASYASILVATVEIAVVVTISCIVVGFPAAYLLAQLPRGMAIFCLSLIIIPFWTSLLVRTYAWLVLLGANGPVSAAFLNLGLITDPLGLIYNKVGTAIGMIHIMLPFFILPLYSTIRSFDWQLMLVASSLGASPVSAFLRVFLPLSMPGIWAGAVLVFIQSLGFYVTPAILGGGKVTMVSMKIASNVQEYFDWGAASAFGVILLLAAVVILLAAGRAFGLDRVLGVSRT